MDFCLDVSGEFACFTRPEMKVERVSYDVITPSAARSIFESILWKPAISWQITRIEVINPIRWINLRRNEIGSVISSYNIKTAMTAGKGNLGLYIEEDRQQRESLLLRDVRYRLHGKFNITDKASSSDSCTKFIDMFKRRAEKGQCINQPYLGCREFACDFTLINNLDNQPKALPLDLDLGWMLYDMNYSKSTSPTPFFFRAIINQGIIEIPALESLEAFS